MIRALASVLLPLSGVLQGCASAARPRVDLSSELLSAAPHPLHREKLALFGDFVGAWEMEIWFFDERGRAIFHGPGRWVFGWVLDGLAVQDVLTYAPLDAPEKTAVGERRIGTSLRQYDAVHDLWNVVWLGASSNTWVVLRGGASGSGIVLNGSEGPGIRNRWSFSQVSPAGFRWRGEISTDGGATWRLEQEMTASRAREP